MRNDEVEVRGVIRQFTHEGGVHYLAIPRAIGARFAGQGRGPARLVCTLGDATFPCGLMPLGEDGFYILLTKKVRDATGVEVGARVTATLRPDTSEHGAPMPEELAEVLRHDDAAARAFELLTPGRKRGIFALVARPRSVRGRVDRAIAIAGALERGITDLKELARAKVELDGP